MTTTYADHLCRDRRLKKLVEQQGTYTLKKRRNICSYLCASIISQQLSTRVADVIHGRFLGLFDGKEPRPEQILDLPLEKLRSVGLSSAKATYIQAVARFELEKGMSARTLQSMDNEEVIRYLTAIKGVGRWTVEMLLMFALGREDVFAVDDLGIQQAMTALYKLDATDKKKMKEEMLRISAKWSPYRTFACMHLWRWKDNPAQK
jgi:DNA-3-methyladenine glycosylase II